MAKISDIATMTGLSNATVSKALNGSKEIPAETAEKVKEAARQLHYVPSSFARTLKSGRAYTIGVLFEDPTGAGLRHEYFSSILASAEAEVESRGYDLTFMSRPGVAGLPTTYLQHAKSRGLDGVILLSARFGDKEVDELAESGIPIVSIDYLYNGSTAILSDNEDGEAELTELALKKGHRKIAFIHGEDTVVTRKRVAGYLQTMAKAGIQVEKNFLQEAKYHDPASVEGALKRVMAGKTKPTCVLCPDDVSALTIRSSRYEDQSFEGVSLAGYDGIAFTRLIHPNLTTYRQASETIGRLASEKLIERIENPRTFVPEVLKVKGSLQEGGTITVFSGENQEK